MKRGFILGPWTYREVGKHLEKCGLVEGSWKKKLLLKGVGEFHFAFLYLFWDRGKDFAHHVIMFKCYNAF